MIAYEVTLEQYVLLPGRKQPNITERVFKVRANSKRSATNSILNAGYEGTVTKVKPVIVSAFE